MKNIMKICVGLIAFLLIGITNVSAASLIDFKDPGNRGVSLTELNLGSTDYNRGTSKSFYIENTSAGDITITNVDIDTDKFSISRMPATTISAGGDTIIQLDSLRSLDASSTPIEAILTVTVNGSEDVTIPVKVTINPINPTDPTYVNEVAIGDKVSTVFLTNGWVWDNPNDSIVAGDKGYSATYTDTTGNYKTTTKDFTLKGLKAYSVTMPTDPNAQPNVTGNIRVLEGYSFSAIIDAENGTYFTSLKINNIEQLTGNADTFRVEIPAVNENIVIETVSERITIFPMEDPITNKIIVPKFTQGNDGSIELKFDYDFADFGISDFSVNGVYFYFEDIIKYFKFREGSVIIEMTNEYLETLDPGTYTLEIITFNGELLTGDFLVEEAPVVEQPSTDNQEATDNPDTSDNILTYSIISIISLIGITSVILYKKKHN